MCRRCRRRLPQNPFRRGAFVAWGPRKGYKGGGYSLVEAAKRTAAAGYEWVALIVDDDGSSQDAADTGAYNRANYRDWQKANRDEGVLAGAWVTQGGNLFMIPSGSDLGIAECEGPGDYQGIINVMTGVGAGPLPTCPLGMVTNFSTLTRDSCKPLIQAGITCMPEAYVNELPHLTPENMDRVARNLGWATSQPVAGMYPAHGDPVPPYPDAKTWPLADYLLEHVI